MFEYPPYELVLASKLVDVVKHEQLDLLHVHYAIPHASAAYMAQQILADAGLQIPFITTLHGTDITLVGKDVSFEPVISFAIKHSNAVTAVSESLKEDTYRHFNVDRPIEVIPNFVCLDKLNKHTANGFKERFAPNGEKIITHISNFRKVKRVEDVVYVFKEIREKTPAKLLLVGDGPERNRVERLCREVATCNDTILLGKLKNPTEVLGISDLFLLPSETESFGLAALEAMACGVPVISSNAGGLPEVNIHGKTGYLSAVGDIREMGSFANELLLNPEKLEHFKQQAKAQAGQFDIKNILPQYEELYQQVMLFKEA